MLTDEHRAEHVGFEPTDAVTRINALAVRPNRPLWQCSARHSTGFIRHLQRRGQPIYGLTCPMRSRRGSNPLIPFRGLTCVPSMRLTVRPLLPVGRAVAPVEDVCRAPTVFPVGLIALNPWYAFRRDMPTEEQAGVEPAHPLFRDSPVFETGALPFGHCSSAGIPSSFTPVRGDFTFGCALGGVTRIRTEGTAHTVQRFSRPPHSAALP